MNSQARILPTAVLDAASADRQRVRYECAAVAFTASLAAIVGVLGLWFAASATIRSDYRHYLRTIAQAAALQVDPALHQRLRDPLDRNNADYRHAVAPLRRMREALPEVRFIYTMVRESGEFHLVLDTADPGDNDGDGIEDQAGLWELYSDFDPFMVAAFGDERTKGQLTATEYPLSDKWGTFMSGWAPLLDHDGRQYGALGIDIDASVYLAHLAQARHGAMIGCLPAALLILLMTLGFHRIRSRSLAGARGAAAEARLLAAQQLRLRNAIEQTDIGIWESSMDSHGNDAIIVDARWAAMLGYRAQDVNPLHATDILRMVHPDDLEATHMAIGRSVREPGRLLALDVRMRHAAGHWVWTEVRGKVVERDTGGRAVHMVGTQMDVSSRKSIETALMESERNFRSLFEMSPVGICLADMQNGRFLKVNDSLLASTGFSREELLQRTFWDITPPSWHEYERGQLGVLEHSNHFGTYEKEYLRKDGSSYAVLISGTQVKDAAGRSVAWAIVQDISERKAMESELADAARRDRLTGLANRTLFMEELQAAVERVREGSQRCFAVLFLDFDRFKLVNDAMGHEAGDSLLREIAARLKRSMRESDAGLAAAGGNLIARFGGDEFLVLVNDLEDSCFAEPIANRLLAALAAPYCIDGRDVHTSASIGVVTSDQCLESAEAVVHNADLAMYEAKRSGRACSVRFDEGMLARLTRYVTIDSGLREALGTPAFSLVYQPIVELATGRMTSVEALARWQHPQLGPIAPSEFIPVAEESGLIVALGQWVLQESCAALVDWRARDPRNAPQSVCVNISRAELALGERLLLRVREALQQSGLPAECLRLEVTERDVMRDPPATLKLMHSLRELGVKLAMDDFGTGTSSLACLRDYPFDVIKIDRSFVSDVNSNSDVLAVIHAAVTLVENLGKTSVAEGVETSAHVAVLQSLGCHYAQGYHFSHPLTSWQMLDYMRRPRRFLKSATMPVSWARQTVDR